MAFCHVAMSSAIDFESLEALPEETNMTDDWISQLLDSEDNGCMPILDSPQNDKNDSFPSLTLDSNTEYEIDIDQVLEINEEMNEEMNGEINGKEGVETSRTSQRGFNNVHLYPDVDSSVTSVTSSEHLGNGGGDLFNDSNRLTDFDLDPMTVMNQEMFVTETVSDTGTETGTGASRRSSPSKEYQRADSDSTNPSNSNNGAPAEELGLGLTATSLFCGDEYYYDRKTETGNLTWKPESTNNNISQKDVGFWHMGQDTIKDQNSDKQMRVPPLNTMFSPYNNHEMPDIKPKWVHGSSMEGTSSGGGVSSNEKGGSGCSGERSSATCPGGGTGGGTGGRKGKKKGGKEDGWEENGEVKEEGHSEDGSDGCNGEGDVEKKQARLMRNRESAQLSRQRKKFYLDELENRLTTMQATVAELNTTISHLTSENVNLRRQLAFYCSPSLPGGGGGGRHLGPMIPMPNGVGNPYGMLGMPPMGLMGLPGVVPSVPIPRLKTNKNNSGAKGGKRAKTPPTVEEKSNTSKGRKRVKTAAGGVGVVALALFCFSMLFSPFESVDNGNRSGLLNSLGNIWVGPGPLTNENNQFLGGGGHGMGRVLMGVEEPQKWENESLGIENSNLFSFWSSSSFGRQTKSESKKGNKNSLTTVKDKETEVVNDWKDGEALTEEKSLVKKVNSTDLRPVPASLFVPQNNQLVKIDGNLIISSIMAGDKAARVRDGQTDSFGLQEKRENYGKLSGSLKAVEVQQLKAMAMVAMERGKPRVEALLPSGSKKIAESKEKEDGQHWFLGGIAGTILSSEECTEIFQFEKYPNPNSPMEREETLKDVKTGGPQTSDNVRTNVTSQGVSYGRVGGRRLGGRRRYSNAVPLPPVPLKNQTAPNVKERPPKGKSQNRSMVVSLLASPLEASSSEHGSSSTGQSGNSLSRIFVVVLVNGVKYVTYSCMLPNIGGSTSTLVQN